MEIVIHQTLLTPDIRSKTESVETTLPSKAWASAGSPGVEIVDLLLALYSGGQIQDLRRDCLDSESCRWVVPCEERVSHHSLPVTHAATLHHDIELEERERSDVEARLDQMFEVKG